jgi:hypothetical protein
MSTNAGLHAAERCEDVVHVWMGILQSGDVLMLKQELVIRDDKPLQ